VISDDEGEKEGSLSDLKGPDRDSIDKCIPYQHSMGFRSRGKGGRVAMVSGKGGEASGAED